MNYSNTFFTAVLALGISSSSLAASPLCALLKAQIAKLESAHAALQKEVDTKRSALKALDDQLLKESAALDVHKALIDGSSSEVAAQMLDAYDDAVDQYNRKYDKADSARSALNSKIKKLMAIREEGTEKASQVPQACANP